MKGPQFKLLFVVILFTLSISTQAFSQTPLPQANGSSYKVHKGDLQSFEYSTLYINGSHSITTSLLLDNGSYVNYDIIQGTRFNIVVVDVNESMSYVYNPNGTYTFQPTTVVYTKEIMNSKNFNFTTQADTYSMYVIPAFDNKSAVDNYVEETNKLYNQSTVRYSADSNYIYALQDSSSNGLSIYYKTTFNWQTGWLQKLELKEHIYNALLADVVVQNLNYTQGGNPSFDNLANYISYGFLVGVPISIIAIFAYTWISYKKTSNKSLNNTISKPTFTNFFKESIKKKRPNQTRQGMEVDKSLNIIEEIIKESNQTK